MVVVDAVFEGLAAATALLFGVLILAFGRRDPPAFYLSAFFFLLATNQGLETLRALAASPEASRTLLRAATVPAALDPVALYGFAAALHGRARPGHPGIVFVLLGVGGALAFAAPWGLTGPDPVVAFATDLALALFTAAAYFAGFAIALLRARESEGGADDGLLAMGMAIAAVPVLTRIEQDVLYLGLSSARFPGLPTARLVGLAVLVGACVALAVGVWRVSASWGEPGRGAARRAVLAGLALTVLTTLAAAGFTLADALGIQPPLALGVISRAALALRWIAFCALVSTAVLRYDLLGFPQRARRIAARILLGLFCLFGAAFVLLLLAELGVPGVAPGEEAFFLVLLVVALSQGFRSALDWIAWRVYGVPRVGDVEARHEAYRRAARACLEQGRVAERDPDLQRLRVELGLDEATSEVLERTSEWTLGPVRVGQLVARRYRVASLIARGGEGRTYLARDEHLGRNVVLKEVEEGEDVLREARLAGSVAHPGVIVVHEVVRREGRAILVMEHAAGGSLEDLLARDGPPSLERGVEILAEVLDALAAVHARGVVHRDVKASNVLLTSDGRAKLADFGIAHVAQGRTAKEGAFASRAGTLGAVAPEQWRGGRITPVTDVYLVGRLAQRLLAAPLPPALAAVVERALTEEPSGRWPDAAAFAAALREAAPQRQ